MGQRVLPRVLVVDVNAWREDATSNTLMEIFRCWDPEKLALVYTSSELPNTTACRSFFQIGENQVLKSVFKPWQKVGIPVMNTPTYNDADAQAERLLRARAHKTRSKWMRLAREFVWKLGHWKSSELLAFINVFQPDVLFIPIFPYAYMGRIQKWIIRKTHKPIVCYLADDNYSYDSCQGFYDYVLRSWNRKYVRNLATRSSQMFVIVDKEKEDTDRRFGTDSVILTKSIDFTDLSYLEKLPNNPLKFVYTGSLLIGRSGTICKVADAINELNSEYGETLSELFVYSQTSLTEDVLSHLNVGASHFCGCVSHQVIQTILKDADVVVFAEALHGKEANVAKLSFSTKITDYLANGKCILAIGKEDIAPIDYFRRNNAALLAYSEAGIKQRIREIINDPSIINKYGRNAFSCALRNHEKKAMNERFISTMCKATKPNSL